LTPALVSGKIIWPQRMMIARQYDLKTEVNYNEAQYPDDLPDSRGRPAVRPDRLRCHQQ
jgi:hypothetical protein